MYNHVVPQNIEHMYMCIYRNGKLKKLHLTVHKDLHSFRARARARATSIYIVHVLLLYTQYLLSSPSALRWCLDGSLLISEIKRSFV